MAGLLALSLFLSLVLPIVLNHHPMTSFLQQQTLSPLRPLKKKRGKEKGNLIIPFNQKKKKKKKRAKSRTKKWRLLYSSGEAALSTSSSSSISKWKEGKKTCTILLNLEREPLSLHHRRPWPTVSIQTTKHTHSFPSRDFQSCPFEK